MNHTEKERKKKKRKKKKKKKTLLRWYYKFIRRIKQNGRKGLKLKKKKI